MGTGSEPEVGQEWVGSRMQLLEKHFEVQDKRMLQITHS